jgi:hypothetical protein
MRTFDMLRTRRSHRRFTLATFAAIAVLLIGATLAAAKEGGMARLAAPLPADAEPGSTITVYWSLESFVNDNGDMGPFSAGGVYIKLIGLDVSEAFGRETTPGNYVADVVVPNGGIRAAEFGVAGEATVNGVSQRTNMVFQFDGILLQRNPPPKVAPNEPAAQPGSASTTQHPATAPAINPLLILGAMALALAGIGTVLAVRRRGALA